MAHKLVVESLTAETFHPFGDVIEAPGRSTHVTINAGYAERYDDLAHIDVGRDGGTPRLSIFRATPRAMPCALTLLERHPLGSQAFVPLSQNPFLIVVAAGDRVPDLSSLRCFLTAPGQGVNYAAGVWHHPLLALHARCDFVVIDRGGPEPNCDEAPVSMGAYWIDLT